MEVTPKTVAAVVAAVTLYMQTAEGDAQAAPAAAVPGPQREPRSAVNLWALSGRQSMMEMRRMLQMRFVK